MSHYIEQALQKIPFLALLAPTQRTTLIRLGQVTLLEPEEVIFREGDTSNSMYVILSGAVQIVKTAAEDTILLVQLKAGDFFGELALLDSQPRSATAICLDPCELFTITQAAFRQMILESHSEAVFQIFSTLTQRVRETSDKYLREELENQQLASQMEIERLRSLTQMVTGVAHEINTPLGIVNTAASILKKTLAAPELQNLRADRKTSRLLEDAEEALDLIQRNVERAHRLTQDFKKVSASQLSDTLETFNLVEALEEILDLFRIQARESHLEIELLNQTRHETPQWQGYRGYLSQVLLNLLTNCERYAYPDKMGGKVEIALTTVPQGRYKLIVTDWGKGIAADDLAKIFEPFFTTGRHRGGTGLGMTIIHNIISVHLQGSIQVDSELGKGTQITVLFPQQIHPATP